MKVRIIKSQKNNPIIVLENGKNQIFGSKKVGKFIFDMPELKKQAIDLINKNYVEPYRTSAIRDINIPSSAIAEELVIKICTEGSYAAASTLAYYLSNNQVSKREVKNAADQINPDTEEPYWMEFEELQDDFIATFPLWIFNRINDAIL